MRVPVRLNRAIDDAPYSNQILLSMGKTAIDLLPKISAKFKPEIDLFQREVNSEMSHPIF